MKVAYIRVTSIDQNEQRQITEMKKFGAEKFFIEKQSGATITHRPTWKKLRRNHCFSQLPKEEKRAADHHQSTDHG